MVFGWLFNNRRARHGELFHEIESDMIPIATGSFLMGSNDGEDDERPIHNVLVEGFFLSKYVVTQRQWWEVMQTKPWKDIEYACDGDGFPAINVSWYDVKQFIGKLGRITGEKYRLPTEAEWEYACRAGATSRYIHGSLKLNLSQHAWYYDNAFKKDNLYAHEIGLRKPNKWGLYDMSGNVYEWCFDWYNRNYYNKSPMQNPQGPIHGKYKVARGGDWSRTEYFLRVASRRYYSPHYRDVNVGFRLAR